MNLKLDVKKYLNNDVIVTSGHHTMSGMSSESYQLWAAVNGNDACAWKLADTSIFYGNTKFDYYDENGNKIETNIKITGWIDYPDYSWQNLNKWFHYDSEGNIQICNDISHQHQSN